MGITLDTVQHVASRISAVKVVGESPSGGGGRYVLTPSRTHPSQVGTQAGVAIQGGSKVGRVHAQKAKSQNQDVVEKVLQDVVPGSVKGNTMDKGVRAKIGKSYDMLNEQYNRGAQRMNNEKTVSTFSRIV